MTAWFGLAVLLSLAAHGFLRKGLFAQIPFWHPKGWRRLALFTAVFAVWTAAISLRWRSLRVVRAEPNWMQAFLSVLIAIVLARVPRLIPAAALCVALHQCFLPMSSTATRDSP